MEGLSQHTEKVIDRVSKLECIKPYLLVGGTALSLQLHHRLSEDLDFMKWVGSKGEKPEVDWTTIKKEFEAVGEIRNFEILDSNHIVFEMEGVKFSFYSAPRKSPVKEPIPLLNNIRLSDIDSVAIMKMEVFLRRSKFRDYYDIYCIFKDKNDTDIRNMINEALKHSGHAISSKSLLAILTNGDRFAEDKGFALMQPKYNINGKEIENFMIKKIQSAYLSNEIGM